MAVYKICFACKQEKGLSDFNKSSANKDGRQSYCRECARDKARQKYRRDPQVYIDRALQWQAENPDKVKTAYETERWKNHHRNVDQNRRAIKLGTKAEKIDRVVVYKRDKGICGICIKPVDQLNWHLDHIKPLCEGGAHTYDNVRVTHPSCNMRRRRRG